MDAIVIPYIPRPMQLELHNEQRRFNVYNIHRRWGKTVFAINNQIKKITSCKLPNARGAYIAPLYRQAKTVAWEYLKEFTRPIPGMKYNESELRADFPTGARMSLYGGDNPNSLRGIYLDDVVLDEVAQMSPMLWTQVIRPALTDRKGTATFIGTPFGMNNLFHKLYEDAGDQTNEWHRRTINVVDSNIIDLAELEAARRQMSPEEFEQEFMCSWSAAIKGAYFAKQMAIAEDEGRITSVPYDESLPVITSWDLGVKDATVVWYWQVRGTQIMAIRCDSFQGMKLKDIIQQVGSYQYIFAQHIAPFDINVRELGAGSRLRLAADLGVKFTVAPSASDISRMSGIDNVRNMISRVIFDRANCKDGIEALKTYRSEYNEKRKRFSDAPLHDWSSDYADSVRYFAITKLRPTLSHLQQSLDYKQHDQGIF